MRGMAGRMRIASVIAAVFLFAGAVRAQSGPPLPVVEQPRAFGYVVGDLLTQRVLLQVDGRSVSPADLPTPGRVGVWFERRSARVDTRPDGRRWLAIEYQVINAPKSLTTVSLPAWQLKTTLPGHTLQIPEWPISVGPLAPEEYGAEGALAALQPDRAAPSVPTSPIRNRVFFWSSALIVVLLAWVGWLLWRNYLAASRQPFAEALREMRHAEDGSERAWQQLHRAFDRTAGRVVQLESLPQLFRRAPHLVPLRPRIEQFFAQSSERFFGAGPPAEPISVHALCADLRRLEKRHER